jgi:hypothetical protein
MQQTQHQHGCTFVLDDIFPCHIQRKQLSSTVAASMHPVSVDCGAMTLPLPLMLMFPLFAAAAGLDSACSTNSNRSSTGSSAK